MDLAEMALDRVAVASLDLSADLTAVVVVDAMRY